MSSNKELTNHLLLIAIDNYQDTEISNLTNCVSDAIQLRDVLQHKYFFISNNTEELINENASCDSFHKIFEKYVSELTEEDNLVIFYTGHGHYNSNIDRGYWIPSDARYETPSSYFSNPDLLDYLRKIKTQHIVLISDSCFSRSILTDYEPTKSVKNLSSLYNSRSRWALTAGQFLAYERNGFAETMISVLKNATKDVLISELIQKVKEAFLTNDLQTPQGTPLRDMNHQAGEFIFMIKDEEQEDEKEFKVHKDALKILQLYNKNTKFKEMWRVTEGNSKHKVGYVIFLEKNVVYQKDYFYLFLYQGIHLSETFNHLQTNYPQIFKLDNLIILLPKEKEQKNYDKRIKKVSENLKSLSIFYIDDFIREECSPLFFNDSASSKYLQISNFVFPSIKIINKNGSNTFVENFDNTSFTPLSFWFENGATPILVIKGSGGIGKTTLAKYISDIFLQINKKSKVIFIESKVIVSKLNGQEEEIESDTINLYNLYEAATPDSNERLSKDVFKLNFDAGNILIVIDGLDEIISNVRKFKADEFLNSIEKFTDEIHDGKLIITCRSYFWEANKYTSNLIQSIEILPFNKDQAAKFFKASFPNDEKKVERCISISKEFSFPTVDGVEEYQPYALDVIRLIINSQRELLERDASFNSNVLEQKNRRDYILFRICNRELDRVNQISVDDQIKFFTHLAVTNRGILKSENFRQEVFDSLGREINDTNIEAFKGHPLLHKLDSYFRFKYDFFIDYFRNIYISSFIRIDSQNETISNEFIHILAESCWFGSEMVDDIKERIQSWDDTDLLKISDLIQQISGNTDYSEGLRRKAVSGLFSIALAINHKFHSNSISENTILLKILFESQSPKGHLHGLSIVNFLSGNDTIRFDFSNLIIHDCYINTFHSFWKCAFNDATKFLSPTLLNIEPIDSSDAVVIKDIFINPSADDKFSVQFEREELKSKNIEENIIFILKNFFRQFHIRGKIDKQPYTRLKLKFTIINQKYFDFKRFIKTLESNDLIYQFSEQDTDKIDVNDTCKTDISKFVNDGSMSPSVQLSINKLIEIAERK